MGITFDDGELAGSNYLGEGEHEVAITKITPTVSKEKGTQQIEVQFTGMSGKGIRDWFPIEGNKFKLAALALACGFTKEALKAGQFEVSMLPGKPLKIVRGITGKTSEGKNQYQNTYLASAKAKPSGMASEEIPF